MKSVHLLIWLTQLGLSVAMPPVLFIWLAVWLHSAHGWGGWVVWVGVFLGVYSAIQGLRSCLKAMTQMAKDKEEKPPVSYNDHT